MEVEKQPPASTTCLQVLHLLFLKRSLRLMTPAAEFWRCSSDTVQLGPESKYIRNDGSTLPDTQARVRVHLRSSDKYFTVFNNKIKL